MFMCRILRHLLTGKKVLCYRNGLTGNGWKMQRGGCGVFAAHDWILESQLYKCVRETASWVLENILSQIQRRISFFDLVCVDFKLFARITQTIHLVQYSEHGRVQEIFSSYSWIFGQQAKILLGTLHETNSTEMSISAYYCINIIAKWRISCPNFWWLELLPFGFGELEECHQLLVPRLE